MKQEQTPQDTQLHNAPLKETEKLAGTEKMYLCANCDIEFFWSPTVVQEKIYCCTGCAAGGPCNCDYSLYRSVTIMGIIHYEL
jgi:hypothetical protein